MFTSSIEKALLREWADYIEDPDVKSAFWYLAGIGSSSDRYECRVQWKGTLRDFRFYDSAGEQPFSFITNRHSLLFYFRSPAVRSGFYSFNRVSSLFEETSEKDGKEWTVRIRTVEDVDKISDHIGLRPNYD